MPAGYSGRLVPMRSFSRRERGCRGSVTCGFASLGGNSTLCRGQTPLKAWGNDGCKGSFDCDVASLCEATSALKMTVLKLPHQFCHRWILRYAQRPINYFDEAVGQYPDINRGQRTYRERRAHGQADRQFFLALLDLAHEHCVG